MNLQNILLRRFTIGILGIVLVYFLQIYFTANILSRQESDAYLINIAGRQRMLSQKISKAILKLNFGESVLRQNHLSELMSSNDLFIKSHQEIRELNLGQSNEEVLLQINKVDQLIKPLIELAKQALDQNSFVDKSDYFKRLTDLESSFLPEMNKLVHLFEKEAKNKVDKLNYWQTLFGLLFVVSILFVVIFIFEPAYREISLGAKKLEDNNKKLTQSNEELEEFAYRLSHDLKAPLLSVMGLLDIVEMDVEDKNYNALIDSTGLMRENLDALHDTTDSVMTIIKGNMDPLDPSRVNINEIIEAAKQKHNILIRKNNLNIMVNRKVDIVNLPSKEKFELIFENLLSNAIKYCDPSKKVSWIKINISVNDNKELILEISDNGLGIPEQHKEKVFEMFTRIHNVSHGSGLGLAYVKKALVRLGGDIKLSLEEDGTKFTVTIPLLPAVAAA